jgi:hypothetical protein
MRQRNDTGYPLTVATLPPVVVEPGDTIDNPDPVIGFTPVDDKPTRSRRSAQSTDAAPETTPAPAADGQEA